MTKKNEHPSLEEMIAEVKREIALREQVFPGLITKRKMKRPQADEHMRRIRRVLYVLEWLNGRGVDADRLPRPADLLAVVVHVETKLLEAGPEPDSLGDRLRKACTDTLTGLPGRDSKQQAALRKLQELFLSPVDHENFRLQTKKIVDGALS